MPPPSHCANGSSRPLRDRRAPRLSTAHALFVALLASSCSERERPWDQPGAPPAPPSAAGLPNAPRPEPETPEAARVARATELYGRCAEGLRPSDDPVRDVVRLGTSCGPSTGMQRAFEVPREGVVGEGNPPIELQLRLRAGRCYRVFAVAEPSVEELSVELRSSRGTTLARDRSSGRVVVLQPEGPLCAAGDDDAVVAVAARRGRGRFALELWWHVGAGLLAEPEP